MIDNNSLAKDALKMGAFFGLIQVVITMLLYVMGVEYMVKWWAGVLVIVSIIVMQIVAGKRWRTSNNDIAPFGKMFLFLWLNYIALMFVSTVFNVVLYTMIDPDLALNMKEAVIESTMSMMEGFGLEGEALDQALAGFDDFEDKFSFMGQMKTMFISFIGGAVLAAILALFLKKEEPMFDETEEA